MIHQFDLSIVGFNMAPTTFVLNILAATAPRRSTEYMELD